MPLLVALLVQLPVVVPVYTVPPLAAIIKSLNITDINILSSAFATCGTIVELYLVVPFSLLYPPVMSGSKLDSCKASPGCIVNTSLLSTRPPAQLAVNGF